MHYRPDYPDTAAARDRFVIDLRSARPAHDPWRYQDVLLEDERTERGDLARVGTVFLTGRECPWRCAMCDLWRFTTRTDTPAGAIPAQIRTARQLWRSRGDLVTRVKLYNASNFFDPRAVPASDYGDIAAAIRDERGHDEPDGREDVVEQVTVESHPSLIGERVGRFLEALDGRRLEVAMGLETVHPAALDALNKRMTTEDFSNAANILRRLGVSLRAFVLIAPPFVPHEEQDDWLLASVAFAEECGASVISLIPTRGGNGTMEALTAQKRFVEPTRSDIERSFALVLARVPSPESRAPSPEPGVPSPEPRVPSPEPRVPTRIFLDPWVDHAR
jgi:radical SAM enzyme (TIGR01210 family)